VGALLSIKPNGLHFDPGQKIIKAREYLSYIEADRIIESAREEGERIVAEARKVYEAEKQRGFEKGLEEGKGIIAERMIETVRKTVDYFASVEETLCDLVVSAIRKIIGEMDNRELMLKVIRNALNLVRNQKQVILRVCPADAPMVQNSINDIIADFPGIGFIDVVADARLKQNGCILESEMGIIDASLDVQLEAIRRSLSRSIKRTG
jgi:type III secretion protein L